MTAVTALEKRADLFETARTSLTTSSTEGVDRTVADNSYYAATFGLIGVSAGAGGAAVSDGTMLNKNVMTRLGKMIINHQD